MIKHNPLMALRVNASTAAVEAMQGVGSAAKKYAALYGLALHGLKASPYNTDFKNWVNVFETKAQSVVQAGPPSNYTLVQMRKRVCKLAPGYFPRSWCASPTPRAHLRHVFPPAPPPGHGHYISPSGHVHYYERTTGRVSFVAPPPPPGVTFLGPRPPTPAHAVFVAPPLPPPPAARIQVRYVQAPPPPPGVIHYVTRSGQVHYVQPATGRIIFVAPAPPPGVVYVAPPPPTPAAAIVVAPPSAPPPPAVIVEAPPLTAPISPATVVDQGSDQIRQKATELANGLTLQNRDAFASAQKLSADAQGGDWLSKQVLNAAHGILVSDSAPDDMLHAVDWASNGDPNDLDSTDVPGARGSGGSDPYGSISGDPRSPSSRSVQKQVEATVRGADNGDQNSVAMLAALRQAAQAGNPVAKANFAHAIRYAKSRAGSDANASMHGCFGSCSEPCYQCTKIGGERGNARVNGCFGSCDSPCYQCTKIGGDWDRRTARVGFGSCASPCYACTKIGADGAEPCEQCASMGGELSRTDGALESRFGECAPLNIACPCTGGFGDDYTSMSITQPSGVTIPQSGVPVGLSPDGWRAMAGQGMNPDGTYPPGYLAGQTVTHMAYTQPSGVSLPGAMSAGFGAAHRAAAHHAHKKAVHHAKKRAHHAKRMELHRRAEHRHPAFQDGSGSGGSSDSGSGGSSGREPPLKQLLLAAQQGNKQAQARIASIEARAKQGDLRAQSLVKALQAFASAKGSAAQKTGRAVKLSHGKPLTTAQVHGIAAEFGAESIHVLRGVRAPHAPLPRSASPSVREAIAAGQIVGQAQELQAVRFPGAPLPAGVQWEIGQR